MPCYSHSCARLVFSWEKVTCVLCNSFGGTRSSIIIYCELTANRGSIGLSYGHRWLAAGTDRVLTATGQCRFTIISILGPPSRSPYFKVAVVCMCSTLKTLTQHGSSRTPPRSSGGAPLRRLLQAVLGATGPLNLSRRLPSVACPTCTRSTSNFKRSRVRQGRR